MLIGFDRSFEVGNRVSVPSQGYSGDVVDARGAGATAEYLVRYVIPGARRPFYETWWPTDALISAPA